MNKTNEIINIFYEAINPDINYQNKTIRKSADEMIKRYGLMGTIEMCKKAIKAQQEYEEAISNGQTPSEICPTAITPYELQTKIPKFKRYFKLTERRKVLMPETPEFVKKHFNK